MYCWSTKRKPVNRPTSRGSAKRSWRAKEAAENLGRGKTGRPEEKLLRPPFQLTSCAPDSDAKPDWSVH